MSVTCYEGEMTMAEAVETGNGKKYDQGKPKPRLLPPILLELELQLNLPASVVSAVVDCVRRYQREGTMPLPYLEQLVVAVRDDLCDGCQEVLEYGLAKYQEEASWRKVPDALPRYLDALIRHLQAVAAGDGDLDLDEESGLPHAAHALCNAAFLYEIQLDIISRDAKLRDRYL